MSGFARRVTAALSASGVEAVAVDSFGTLTSDLPHGRWLESVVALRDDAGCTYFDWLCAVDEAPAGLRVLVHLLALPASPPGVDAVLVRTAVPAGSRLESLVPVFAGAAWHERETTEMFGLEFVGGVGAHPLLLAEHFEGHPLRKDFTLASRVVTGWPGAKDPATAATGGARRTRRAGSSTAVTPPRGGRSG